MGVIVATYLRLTILISYQTVLSFCYAQRYEEIYFFSMHPGWVNTELLRQSQPELFNEVSIINNKISLKIH